VTESSAPPGPLWPDDVAEAAGRAVYEARMTTSSSEAMARAALNAPEVTAHLRAQREGWREAFTIGIEKQAECTRLAAALADPQRRIAGTLDILGEYEEAGDYNPYVALRAALAGDAGAEVVASGAEETDRTTCEHAPPGIDLIDCSQCAAASGEGSDDGR